MLAIAFTMPAHPHLAMAGDDRFGVATHFQQGWATSLMPSIKALGVGYIRDNISGNWQPTPCHYAVPKTGIGWMYAAQQNGLKIVLILGSNGDSVAVSNLAVCVARSGLVNALEIVNEANNVPVFKGSVGETLLVKVTNAVRAAVHKAVGNKVQVIGLDEQGSQIFYMLSLNPVIDGLVYHPYATDDVSPATAYEWPYLTYSGWLEVLRPKTNLPLWETEWGFKGSSTDARYTYTLQASRIVARLQMTQAAHIEHTFIYEFKDNGVENFGLCDNSGNPKPAYYAVKQFIASLPVAGTSPHATGRKQAKQNKD